MKNLLTVTYASLGLTLASSILHAEITAVVHPATKTISFQGSSERIPHGDQTFYWGAIGSFDHHVTTANIPLQVIGVPSDSLWTFSLPIGINFDSAGIVKQVYAQDRDFRDQPTSIPITAFPDELVSYAALPVAAQFEALLAQGDMILPPRSGPTEPIIFTLKEVADTDEDGVADEEDDCPNSDLRATVFVGDCDSGVSNLLEGEAVDSSGCSLADYVAGFLAAASLDARNHGQFVRRMAHALNALVEAEAISWEDHTNLMSCVGGMKND